MASLHSPPSGIVDPAETIPREVAYVLPPSASLLHRNGPRVAALRRLSHRFDLGEVCAGASCARYACLASAGSRLSCRWSRSCCGEAILAWSHRLPRRTRPCRHSRVSPLSPPCIPRPLVGRRPAGRLFPLVGRPCSPVACAAQGEASLRLTSHLSVLAALAAERVSLSGR